MALPQQNRLRSSRDFSKVYRKGKRAATQHLAVRAFKARPVVSAMASSAKAQSASNKQHSRSVGGSPSALLLRSEPGRSEPGRVKPVRAPALRAEAQAAEFQAAEFQAAESQAEEGAGLGPRFGISISRKVHKHAVVRNRIKRQLRAIIREHFLAIAPQWQIVIIVRPLAVECSFDEFLRELEYLLQKLAVL
ncbi:MAG: ribonuclease P protein component [Phormidesmis sp.]